jgi:CxxC motif-containing protein
MSKEMICIMCPRGCHLKVSKDLVVEGNFCPRGKAYGVEEMTHPTRILTTTMKTNSCQYPRISIKSKEGIPKELIFKAMDEINHLTLEDHVKIGDVVIHNICQSGVDMIATKNI